MKILVISFWFPYPPNNGSKIRAFNLLKALSNEHHLDLLTFYDEPITPERLARLKPYFGEIGISPRVQGQPNLLGKVRGFLGRYPRSVRENYSMDMHRLVEQAHQRTNYDAVLCLQLGSVPYVDVLPPDMPKILEEIELTPLREQFTNAEGRSTRARRGLMWWKTANYVADVMQKFNICTVVSAGEKEILKGIAPKYSQSRIEIVPNGVDVALYQQNLVPPVPNTLIYSGALSFYANMDAMAYFIGEILPLVQEKRPDVKLAMTGKKQPELIAQLPANGSVHFTGYVDNIQATVAQSWISIAPLRLGGGTRLKILEAMAAGVPVVSTRKGCEGINVIHGHDILIADTPADFAAQVMRLLEDEALHADISRNALETVKQQYDWPMIGRVLGQAINRM